MFFTERMSLYVAVIVGQFFVLSYFFLGSKFLTDCSQLLVSTCGNSKLSHSFIHSLFLDDQEKRRNTIRSGRKCAYSKASLVTTNCDKDMTACPRSQH